MKKLLLVPIVFAVSCIAQAQAATVDIEWFEPENYRDIKVANGGKKAFQERVLKDFTGYFTELAATLPDNQVLKLKVTDIDLAGDIKYMVGPNNQSMRVITDLYFPRMKFSYQLTENGEVIQAGDENIKDMGFNMSSIHHNSESFYYEKEMIEDWFKDTFKQD
ncbi:DUF3016 domain-containing protein [Thalassomonas sp. M1454]|uniref:DUF3016 domain-containing protein n=1 Tax=Thalassomonas sp. M1454 TaxID=2594477 RepID=UPI00117FE33B|nr:DUF3016 domain-containing protein [Thalassomonas sp. M1454]TRX53151.1 DUF3016 domain-containing protein [Thalassomonas sp. M1454]